MYILRGHLQTNVLHSKLMKASKFEGKPSFLLHFVAIFIVKNLQLPQNPLTRESLISCLN